DRRDRPAGVRARRGGPADPPRVRRAPLPGPPPGSGVLAQPADGRRVAVLLLHRHFDRHGPHQAPAVEDRSRPRPAAAHPDRVGGRIPVPAVSAGKIASWARLRAGSLPRQFALVVAIVVAPVLVALALVGSLMVVSNRSAELLAAIVVAAGLVAIVAARIVAGSILCDVHAIRDGLMAVGRGRREGRIETSAHDELAQLAGAANVMIAQLRDEEAARDQSDAARRDLIAAVSHDLRTPITSLRLLSEAIGDGIVDDPEMRRGYLRRMTTHIDAASVLIDALFELS